MNVTNEWGVPNQYVVITKAGKLFQSYNTNIALITKEGQVVLDKNSWDCSVTTGKYRNKFLGEDKKITQKKIDSGEYLLADINNESYE